MSHAQATLSFLSFGSLAIGMLNPSLITHEISRASASTHTWEILVVKRAMHHEWS
jgi:hypothetical protein